MIGHTDIDHQGVSLIEKYIDKNQKILTYLQTLRFKKIYDSLYHDTINLNPDYAMNVLVDLSTEGN